MENFLLPVETTTITLPESKKQIKIRPIKVREEQILIMGKESENPKDFPETISQVVNSCIITNNASSATLSMCDFLYTFMKLREISRGTTTTIVLTCLNDECKHEETKDFKLEDILNIETKNISNIVKITENYALQFKIITYDDYIKVFLTNNEKPSRILYKIAAEHLLTSVLINEQNIPVTDTNKKDIIENLTQSAMDIIQEWFENQSVIYTKFEWTCQKCKKENTFIDVDPIRFFVLA